MIKEFFIQKCFKKASENIKLCRYNNAIKYLNKILFFDKNNVDALDWKGHCYACLFNEIDSLKCYEKAFNLLPDSDELIIRKGSSYYILHEYELAINCFKKVFNPDSPDIFLLCEIGLSYLYLDEYSEALFYFNEILKVNENDSNAYTNIGLVHAFQDDHDAAIKYYDIALDIDSENIIALSCKADSLLAEGNFSESLECLNRVLLIKDDIIMTKLTRSYVLSYLDEFDESLNGFDEIASLDFDDYNLIRIYHSYYAKSLVNMERLGDALKVYDDFLENYPFNEDMQKDRDELFEKINNQ